MTSQSNPPARVGIESGLQRGLRGLLVFLLSIPGRGCYRGETSDVELWRRVHGGVRVVTRNCGITSNAIWHCIICRS